MIRRTIRFPLVISIILFGITQTSHAIDSVPPIDTFATATITAVLGERNENAYGYQRTVQDILMTITSGTDDGMVLRTENSIIGGKEDMRMKEGDHIVVRTTQTADGITYVPAESYRLPSILWITIGFLLLTIMLGGKTGISSIAGLCVSILVLTWYVVPHIANGASPMTTSMIGAFVIACTSLYLAHGFNRRTSVALLSTLLTLGIAAFLAIVMVHLAHLYGTGSEESIFLQGGAMGSLNLRGLLLGGIIIGCLGVLDDVTTSQVAAIDEIRKANPSLSIPALMRAGFSVGREHIASLINTLALAYAGSSLPLLLLFRMNDAYPLWVTLNSEFIAEEVIRTLVGSSALLLAVPISTWLAARLLRIDGSSQGRRPCHGHSHGAA